MHDKCPEVVDPAKEVYNGYGDMEMADRCFIIDRKSRVLTMTDFQAESGEKSVTLEGGQTVLAGAGGIQQPYCAGYFQL